MPVSTPRSSERTATCKQEPRGTHPFGIAGQREWPVGPEHPSANDQRNPRAGSLHRRCQRAPVLGPVEIGIDAGASEKADGIDARSRKAVDENRQSLGIDDTIGICGRESKGGKGLGAAMRCGSRVPTNGYYLETG